MEDMDELDNHLLHKNFDAKTNKTLGVGETKKKVVFKDLDDSDSLNNINPFEDDFKETLKNKPTNSIKDNKLANLFGIKSKDPVEAKDSSLTNASIIDNITAKKSPLLPIKHPLEKKQSQESILKESDFLGLPTPPSVVSNPENSKDKNIPKMKSVFDNDDITSNLTEKTQAPLSSQGKKSALIEDLFGSRPKSSSFVETNTKKNTFNFDVPVTRPNPKESITGLSNESTNKLSNESGFSLSASKESRRGRRASTFQSSDPLGFFSASTSQSIETSKVEEKFISPSAIENISKAQSMEELPEWLGGPKASKEQKQETEKITKIEVPFSVKSNEPLNKSLNKSTVDIQNIAPVNENVDQTSLTSKLLSIEFNQHAAMMNVQQQEHELRTAATLSHQSEKFNYLLETQKIKLTEQEKQFNMLIARQLERQSILEAQMKSHQDRIDSYIQTLAAQPITIPSMNFIPTNDIKINSKEDMDEKEDTESLLQKVQLEKLYLENTLDSLREKHEKEILILEDSYKKQVAFLEEAMVQMEKRMQDEVECLEADYKHKIQKLKEYIAELEREHKSEKEVLKEENATLIQEIRDNHSKNLEIIQKEHVEIIKRITQSKEIERNAIQIMNVDGKNIQNILNKSQAIIENLEDLQKKLENKNNNFTESHNNHLLLQEKNIEYLKELLEKQKDAFNDERQKLMATIQKLQLDSSELVKEFQIQNVAFKENQEILKLKEQALLRDREIFTEHTKWERERLQILRDESGKEQDKQLEWLAQERQTLVAEKGKFQIFNRLKLGADDSLKIELEATIKAAQNAAASANQERLKWQEKINELQEQQNTLQEKENHLVKKAKELQAFTQSALAKRDEGLRALKEAQFIEQRFQNKMSQIQTQQEALLQRENKLASEKLELAKERLTFRVSHDVEAPVKDIINRVESKYTHEDPFSVSEVPISTKITPQSKDIVDPHLVMLKWELDNKLEASKKFPFIASH